MKLLTLDYQGMAVYASREAWFNAIGCVLMGSYYPAPETRPKAGFTALLHGLAKPCRNLTVAGVLYRQTRLPENKTGKPESLPNWLNPQRAKFQPHKAETGLFYHKQQQAIDNHCQHQQNAASGFNQPPSRGKLDNTADKPHTSNRAPQSAAIAQRFFYVCIPLGLPFMVSGGKVSACACWFVLPVFHPLPFACRPPCGNGKRQRS